MRFILSILFLVLLIPQACADVWYPVIQVQCEPEKKIFEVRDITVGETVENGHPVPDIKSIKTPGAIFWKKDKISWGEDEKALRMTGIETEQGLDIPSCMIEERHNLLTLDHKGKNYPNGISSTKLSNIEFRVERTRIEPVSARGLCGAAGGAEFTVYVNNVALGLYPSAKQRCLKSFVRAQTVSYSPSGLKHCQRPDFIITPVPGYDGFKTDISVCHEGSAISYLKYKMTSNEDLPDEDSKDIANSVQNNHMSTSYNTLSREAHKTHINLLRALKKNEQLLSDLHTSKSEIARLTSERNELKIRTEIKSKKPFWKRVFRNENEEQH